MEDISSIYNRWLYEYADQRAVKYPTLDSPLPIIIILVSYLVFCKKIGPAFMKRRKAFDLKLPIQAYNLLQVAVCAYCVIKGVQLLSSKKIFECLYHPSDSDYDNQIVTYSWLYHVLKIVDLWDTVFFVLRKKESLISTLHMYHHTSMPICSYLIFRYYPGGEALIILIVNSVVHVFMYAYYFYCQMRDPSTGGGSVWWKKHITQLQLLQFAIVAMWFAAKLWLPGCGYPKSISAFILLDALFMMQMFARYYFNAFIKPQTVKKWN